MRAMFDDVRATPAVLTLRDTRVGRMISLVPREEERGEEERGEEERVEEDSEDNEGEEGTPGPP